MDRILVTGMEFYGYHGVLPEETRLGQRFIFDLEICLDLAHAGQSDSLDDTIDYVEVYRIVKELAEGQRFQLIEALAESIAQKVLRYAQVKEVVVKIRKPGAPVPGILDSVGVEICRGCGNRG